MHQKMTKTLTISLQRICFAALIFTVQTLCRADTFCDPCEPVNCGIRSSAWNFGGWIEAGIMANQYDQKDAYIDGVLDPESGNTGHLKNVKHASFQMNQLWFYGEKQRNRRGFDIGGRMEFIYGVDGRHFQAYGLDRSNTTGKRWGEGDYYASLPQMYAEAGYKNFSIKAGKFFTVMGLDSSCAPNRFFYSTSYENQTYIDFGGILATWDASKNFTVFGGWVNGEERFFTDSDHNAFLGGVNGKIGSRLRLDYSVLIGEDNGSHAAEPREYFVNSLVARLKLNKRWDYAVAWLLRNESSLETDGEHWGRYGINQELFYTVNDRWSLGFGAEWLKNYDNRETDYDVYSFRFGANWKPNARFTLRPEIRYDKHDGSAPFNVTKGEPKEDQFLYGFSGIMTF